MASHGAGEAAPTAPAAAPAAPDAKRGRQPPLPAAVFEMLQRAIDSEANGLYGWNKCVNEENCKKLVETYYTRAGEADTVSFSAIVFVPERVPAKRVFQVHVLPGFFLTGLFLSVLHLLLPYATHRLLKNTCVLASLACISVARRRARIFNQSSKML
jgi:hypothetical protein